MAIQYQLDEISSPTRQLILINSSKITNNSKLVKPEVNFALKPSLFRIKKISLKTKYFKSIRKDLPKDWFISYKIFTASFKFCCGNGSENKFE
jgi:hypothetical protein